MKVKFFAVLAVLGALLFASCANASNVSAYQKEDLVGHWIGEDNNIELSQDNIADPSVQIEINDANFQVIYQGTIIMKGYFTSKTTMFVEIMGGEAMNLPFVKE